MLYNSLSELVLWGEGQDRVAIPALFLALAI